MPKVSVSIAISSQAVYTHLFRLLTSLQNQTQHGVSYEVLVGSPNTLESMPPALLQNFPALRWIHSEGGNLSELRNRLYHEARGSMVYFLDEDCELPDGFLAYFAQSMRFTRGTSAYAGFYRSPENSGVLRRAYNSMANLWLKAHLNAPQPLALAGNILLPKMAFAGRSFPFSLQHFFGGEELDLCENLRRHGIRIQHLPELFVYHHCGHSLLAFFQRARLHGRSPSRPAHGPGATVWHHLWAEKNPTVIALVVLYAAVVRANRLWMQFAERPYYVESKISEFAAGIDSHSGI